MALTPEEDQEVKKAIIEYKELISLMDEVGINNPHRLTPKQMLDLGQYKIAGKPIIFKDIYIGGERIHGIQLSDIKYKNRAKKEGKQDTKAIVYVNFAKAKIDLAAYIFEADKENRALGIKKPTVVINNDYVGGKLKDLYALISHEILHGVQRYKTRSPGYEQATEDIMNGLEWDKVDYYTDPGEMEVQIGEVVGNIRYYFDNEYSKYQKFNKTEGYPVKGWEERKKLILEDLKRFFSNPPENYYEYKKFKVPEYLKRSEDFIETIVGLYGASKETDKGYEKKQWEKPWRKLQSALFNVYNELDKKYLKPS